MCPLCGIELCMCVCVRVYVCVLLQYAHILVETSKLFRTYGVDKIWYGCDRATPDIRFRIPIPTLSWAVTSTRWFKVNQTHTHMYVFSVWLHENRFVLARWRSMSKNVFFFSGAKKFKNNGQFIYVHQFKNCDHSRSCVYKSQIAPISNIWTWFNYIYMHSWHDSFKYMRWIKMRIWK